MDAGYALQYLWDGGADICRAVPPYTVQYVKASFTQIDGTLFQAGQVFGGGPLLVLRRILLIMPGMLAGWIMTFTIASRELVGSLLILPPSMQTSATYILPSLSRDRYLSGWRWPLSPSV